MSPLHSNTLERRDGFVDAPSAPIPIERARTLDHVPNNFLDYDPVERARAWSSLLRDFSAMSRQYRASSQRRREVNRLRVGLTVNSCDNRAHTLQQAVRRSLRNGSHMSKIGFLSGDARRCDPNDYHCVVDGRMMTPMEILRDVGAKLREANGILGEEMRALRRPRADM